MTGVPGSWASCDPGNVHVGLTVWSGTAPISSRETTPRDMEDWLIQATADGLELLVLEEYRLYAQLARQQAGSEFLTSQLIGALKLICRLRGVPVLMQSAAVGKRCSSLEPYRSAPQRWWASYGHGEHAKDSERHGWSYLLRVHKFVPEA